MEEEAEAAAGGHRKSGMKRVFGRLLPAGFLGPLVGPIRIN